MRTPDGDDPLHPQPPSEGGEATCAGGADGTGKSAADPAADPERTLGPAAAGATGGGAQTKIGSYTILARLGEGGMGVVYEALQENPRRPVALKIIRGGGFVDEQAVRMFQREAQVLGRLKHPGIAAIYESGHTSDGQYYFAMELVRGVRLDSYLQREDAGEGALGKAATRRRVELFLRICEAVSYAHQRGIIHRDLKPANILVQAAAASASGISSSASASHLDEIKVLDFGLARLTEDELGGLSLATQPGTIQGTVPYMSPEQVRGLTEQIDTRSDVYALGVILYEMLAAELPYDLRRASLPEAARIICEQPPRPLDPNLAGHSAFGRDLGTVLAKALEKDPARRYQSVAALAEDLHRSLHDQPILAQPPSTVYQLRKLYARHRVGFVFAAVMAAVVLGSAISLAISTHRVGIQRDRANREAQVAEGASGYIAITREDYAAAESQFRQLLALAIKLYGPDHPYVAKIATNLGGVLFYEKKYDQAVIYYTQALELDRKLLGGQHPEIGLDLANRAEARDAQGDLPGAEQDYRQALAILQAKVPATDFRRRFVDTNLGSVLVREGGAAALGAAEPLLRTALAADQKTLPPGSWDIADAQSELGACLLGQHRYAAAEPLLVGSFPTLRSKLGANDPATVTRARARIVRVYQALGKPELAKRYAAGN